MISSVHRIFGLQFMDELQKIEAHDSEVLCLEFSPTHTGERSLGNSFRRNSRPGRVLKEVLTAFPPPLSQASACWRPQAEIASFTSSTWRRTTPYSRLSTTTRPPSPPLSSQVCGDR